MSQDEEKTGQETGGEVAAEEAETAKKPKKAKTTAPPEEAPTAKTADANAEVTTDRTNNTGARPAICV